ncbi:MAG: hypothetical protein IJT30_11350 [Muribaculaceae bacterium]|nr:hypothetical protein [Muribaculaceae bacterium]
MKNKNLWIIATVVIALMTLFAYGGGGGGDDSKESSCTRDTTTINPGPTKLNINILLDLSDRIVKPDSNQVARDTAIVGHLADWFTAQCKSWECGDDAGLQYAPHAIKVLFYPAPQDTSVAALAAALVIDGNKLKTGTKEKKEAIIHARDSFNKNLGKIYDLAKQQGQFHGSDIWAFFANGDVDIQCVREGYRNLLVIITDGYLYEHNHRILNGNESNYITDPVLSNPNSKLITDRTDTIKGDLEVLVLEVNPHNPQQLPRMKSLITQWLTDMGVKKAEVWQTQLPVNTQTVIDEFLKQ